MPIGKEVSMTKEEALERRKMYDKKYYLKNRKRRIKENKKHHDKYVALNK